MEGDDARGKPGTAGLSAFGKHLRHDELALETAHQLAPVAQNSPQRPDPLACRDHVDAQTDACARELAAANVSNAETRDEERHATRARKYAFNLDNLLFRQAGAQRTRHDANRHVFPTDTLECLSSQI